MTPIELLAELRCRGLILRAEGDRLRGDAPKGLLTPAIRAALVSCKCELLEILRQAEGARADLTVETVQGLELPQPPRVDCAAVEPAVLAAIGNNELTEPEIRAAVRGNQRWTVMAIRKLFSCGVLTRSGRGRRGSPYRYAVASPSVGDFSIQDSRFIHSVNRETQHQEERRIENPISVEVCVDGTPRRSENAVPSSEADPKPVIPERSGHEDWRTKIAGWSADERMLFEERAAIIEYDGGFPRHEAEDRAFAIVAAMLAACIANRRQEASL